MRGRAGRGDPDFGSDSFLDIIANLVGILVILIVLAGLRAAQVSIDPEVSEITGASSESPRSSNKVRPVAKSIAQPTESEVSTPGVHPSADIQKTEIQILPNPKAELGDGVMPLQIAESQRQELLGIVRGLEARLASLPVDSAMSDLKAVQSELAAAAGVLPDLQQKLSKEDAIRRRSLIEATEFDAEYQALRRQLVEVNQTFEELKTAERPVEDLELRINPVGRRGSGTELMFQIEKGQVVHLPATILFGKADAQTGSTSTFTQPTDVEYGKIGPYNGVTLDYQSQVTAVMVATPQGAAYKLGKMLRGTMRVTRLAPVEHWKDSIEEGGTVSRLMLAAPTNAFARLFVTPDSFKEARRIAAFIRTLGYSVATMPIEPGEHIKLNYGNGTDALVQ